MPNTRRMLPFLLLIGLLSMTGCASQPQLVPVAVPCPKSPSIPACLAAQPQQTAFLPQFQKASQELDRRLTNANQALKLSETKLREALSKPTGTQKP